MKDNPFFSIIVPIYNSELYIESCVKSLFHQDLWENNEYIFIDDASSDRSIFLLKNIIQQLNIEAQDKIKIISFSENHGVAYARKIGIESSTGKYIFFCDSDDWIGENTYRILYDVLNEQDIDALLFNYIYEHGKKSTTISEDIELTSLERDLLSGKVHGFLWNKIFKRDLFLNGIIYPNSNIGEDLILSIQLLHYSSKIKIIKENLYHYRNNNTSITRNFYRDKIIERFEGYFNNNSLLTEILESWGKTNFYASEIILRKFYTKQILNPLTSDKDIRELWIKTYPEINGLIIRSGLFNFKQKLMYISIKYKFYKIYTYYKSIKNFFMSIS